MAGNVNIGHCADWCVSPCDGIDQVGIEGRSAAPWLVYPVGIETFARKVIDPAIAPVRCFFPRLACVPGAMNKNDWITVQLLHGKHVLHVHLVNPDYIVLLVCSANELPAAVRNREISSANEETAELLDEHWRAEGRGFSACAWHYTEHCSKRGYSRKRCYLLKHGDPPFSQGLSIFMARAGVNVGVY